MTRAAPATLLDTARAAATRERQGRFRYRAFGSVMESDVEFPELVPADTRERRRWCFRIDEGEPSPLEAECLGERQLGAERYTLWRSPRGIRLEYSHAGVFELSHDGGEIVWYRRSSAIEELVRSIVIGPVLALALELSGSFCLHGSAVSIGGRAIVFLGPKYHGKSTLATALTAAGARLIGDDLIAVSMGPPAMVLPGVPSVRLWDDAVAALPIDTLCNSVVRGVKTTASGFAERAVTSDEVPLGSIYILQPVAPRGDFWCDRERLLGAAAAIGLARQTKLADSLVGMHGAAAKLATAARLATTAPVWTLTTARDLRLLPRVVARVLGWHSGLA